MHEVAVERAGLTRAHILTTALALTDRDGLTALSMRRLAGELGVEAMTLYHYVPTKDALLDGLVETVFVDVDDPLGADGSPWLTVMTRYADTLRRTLLHHPGVVSLVIARPAATPATLARVEEALALLTRDGFPLARAVDLVNCLSLFVAAHAHSEIATGELLGTGDVRPTARATPSLASTRRPSLSSSRQPEPGPASTTRPASALGCGRSCADSSSA